MVTVTQHRDKNLILLIAGLRAFAYGFLSVTLGLYLAERGFSSFQVGVVLTATLVGETLLTLLGGLFADRFGRRRFLALAAFVAVPGSVGFAFTGNAAVMVAVALVGAVSSRGKDRGPMMAVEQAVLPQLGPPAERTRLFAAYSVISSLAGAAGALLVSGVGLLQRTSDLSPLRGYQALFILAAAIAAVSVLLYARLSASVEAPAGAAQRREGLLPPVRSWRVIGGLSGLFAVDSFGGGFIVQSFLVYWFNREFGLSGESLGVVFFASGVLTSLSFPVAAWLAARIGLLNTMVFTHLPSNALLIAVPFAPTAWGALALYLAREALSQMDVPTRQSYLVAVVRPEERTAAVSITTLSRNAAQASSPSLAGYLLQAAAPWAPFVVGGGIKSLYDAALFIMFRRTVPPEEAQAARTTAQQR